MKPNQPKPNQCAYCQAFTMWKRAAYRGHKPYTVEIWVCWDCLRARWEIEGPIRLRGV